jgi:hypothetical protein
MQDIRIDDNGDQRCWKCGGKNFDNKRTARSKMLVGVGALATHKKLKCQSCGEYNQTGSAKPFIPVADRTRDDMAISERLEARGIPLTVKDRVALIGKITGISKRRD